MLELCQKIDIKIIYNKKGNIKIVWKKLESY